MCVYDECIYAQIKSIDCNRLCSGSTNCSIHDIHIVRQSQPNYWLVNTDSICVMNWRNETMRFIKKSIYREPDAIRKHFNVSTGISDELNKLPSNLMPTNQADAIYFISTQKISQRQRKLTAYFDCSNNSIRTNAMRQHAMKWCEIKCNCHHVILLRFELFGQSTSWQ